MRFSLRTRHRHYNAFHSTNIMSLYMAAWIVRWTRKRTELPFTIPSIFHTAKNFMINRTEVMDALLFARIAVLNWQTHSAYWYTAILTYMSACSIVLYRLYHNGPLERVAYFSISQIEMCTISGAWRSDSGVVCLFSILGGKERCGWRCFLCDRLLCVVFKCVVDISWMAPYA